MNPVFRRINQLFKQALERRGQGESFPAILGNSSGTVLTGTDGIVYATDWFGNVLQVLNRRVPNKPYKHVMLGYDPSQPGVLQVLSERDVFGAQDSDPAVPDHAKTHAYGGGDTDFVEIARFLQFLVLPYEDFTVQIFGGAFPKADGTVGVVANQTLDLSAYQPSAGAKYVLIEYDSDGTIGVVDGSEVDVKELLTVANIPAATGTPICAARLYDGQSELQRNPNGLNDFVDTRFGGPVGGGSGTGGAFQRVLAADLTLADGECLVITGYIDPGAYEVDCQGDAEVLVS